MNKLLKLIVLIGFYFFALSVHSGEKDDFFRAIHQDNESKVIALVLRGVDLNSTDEKGEPGLLLALRLGSLRVADFFIGQPGVNLEAKNPAGETPLMMAALKGHGDLALRLIDRGAEVNKPGWTPLHYAASNPDPGSLNMVKLLLEHHAYIDAESPNRTTPLMMAARYGHPSVVPELLTAGADPSFKNDQKLSAIDFAHLASRPDLVAAIAAAVRASQPAGRW